MGPTPQTENVIHPLVIINISDHYSRENFCALTSQEQNNSEDFFVIGCLLGSIEGKKVEIINSSQILIKKNHHSVKDSGNVIDSDCLDFQFLKDRLEQYKGVFPDLEFLGFYLAGPKCHPHHLSNVLLHMHSVLLMSSFSILILKTTTPASHTKKVLDQTICCCNSIRMNEEINDSVSKRAKISIQLYEIIPGTDQHYFNIPYKIESGEAERISLSQILSSAIDPDVSRSLFTEKMKDENILEIPDRMAVMRTPLASHLIEWTKSAVELKKTLEKALQMIRIGCTYYSSSSNQCMSDGMSQAMSNGMSQTMIQKLNNLMDICYGIERERNYKNANLENEISQQFLLTKFSTFVVSITSGFEEFLSLKNCNE